ncbi:Mes-4 [Drosophila busckii]|uniref:Mes-4 n=1 Tax=Drosophila busckii TaxID=30019 RepID=A0A0M4ER31_DROBS|nr:Mes-4 [Drosophila busckii]
MTGKRDLINLQSNLSPKYIGSPTTVYASDEGRTTRRRNHTQVANSNCELNEKDGESETVACAADSPEAFVAGAQLMPSSSYLSPIDKLLIKNGASSPNSTGFEADAEDVAVPLPLRKQTKRKMKRGPKTKLQVAIEEIKTEQINETEPEAIKNGQTIENEQIETSEVETVVKSTEVTQAVVVDVDMGHQLTEIVDSEMKPSPDITDTANNSEQSVKSPSTISLDSAKGSSIVTDAGWPTYQVGELYWGKLFTYCYWPCMVCPDQFDQVVGNLQVHPQRKSTDSASDTPLVVQVHVRFFADNGRYNWIKSENLMPFNGLPAYDQLREEIRQQHGPKSMKYRQMVPKQNKVLVWRQAIDEANQVAQCPYAQRLDKFYEIYEQSQLLNKEKRKRSKSMYQDSSDVGSSLYDSMDNLHARQLLAIKRERSTSPCSPAFSPVKRKHDMRSKRRKLSSNLEEHVGNNVASTPDVINYKNPEFGQLFDAIKDYVMVYRQEEKVEKVLLAVVRNIWSLKQLQLRELERDLANNKTELLGSAHQLSTERGNIKRLSNRLKTKLLRRSETPVTVTPSPTEEHNEPQHPLSEQPKTKKPTGRPVDEVVSDILQLDRKYLFRGLNREPVCKYCYEPGSNLQRCGSNCNSWFHAGCLQHSPKMHQEEPAHITGDLDVVVKQPSLICHECTIGTSDSCCICHQMQLPVSTPPNSPEKSNAVEAQSTSQLIVCSQPLCSIRFHAACCKYWPQASISSSSSARCPMHVCHTCVSDDPSGKFQHLGNSKLIKCVKCPATYHQDSRCIPAGSRMLTATYLICPRHNIAKADAHLNVLWCYICVRGGELVCCETCPIAVHAHCRNIPIKTNESYICEECESGRLPLYGEIVWAKFNNFRWWPAIILPPTEIPSNILKKPHGLNDFVVRFFGTNDHGWISRRRVYLYIEGDTGDGYKSKSLMSKHYKDGVEEATRFLQLIKAKRQEQAIGRASGSKLQPPPYVKIKANKPVPPVRFVHNEEDVNVCECKPNSEHPCGPESGCLNRMLYHECHPDHCRAGSKCENKLFELRKSPRLDVVYMNERGFGLVCREPIAEGTFVIEYVGEVINHAEFQRRMAQKTRNRDENFYFLGVEKDFIIDAGPKGNLARFMNHSCAPNCATQKWTVNCINRVGLFAIKDIPEDTELTFNYLWDDLMNNGKKACFCGSKGCSGAIGGKLKEEQEANSTSVKSKANSKLKQMQRGKGLRIHVAPAKKNNSKKLKNKQSSSDNAITKVAPQTETDVKPA